MMKMKINVELEILFNENTGEYEIQSSNQQITKQERVEEEIKERYQMNYSDLKYGILSFGSNSEIGKRIPKNSKLKVEYVDKKGQKQSSTTISHKRTQGRISRLTNVFKDLGLKCGHTLEEEEMEEVNLSVLLDTSKNKLKIKKL